MRLQHVLWVKIAFTLLAWCLPLLTFPPAWFDVFGMPAPQPLVLARLLGAAFLALLVDYLFGLHALRYGRSVRQTVWVGIVSNGSASLILFASGLTGAWEAWGGVGTDCDVALSRTDGRHRRRAGNGGTGGDSNHSPIDREVRCGASWSA